MERPILRMSIMPIVVLALACSVIAQAEEIGTERGMKTDIKSESEYLKLEQAMPNFQTLENSASLAMPVLALDSVAGFPGDIVDFYLKLENTVSVSSFNILFNYDASVLAAVQVDNLTGRSASFEYFSYQLDAGGIQGNIRLTAIADLNQDNSHLPLSAGSGQIARLKFSISRNLDFAGFNIPVKFKFLDSLSKNDNTLTDSSGAKIQQEEIAYQDGAITIKNFPESKRGDINLNGLAFEIGDAIYFINHYINPIEYPFNNLQLFNSDINQDGIAATLADMIALINIIVEGKSPSNSTNHALSNPTAEIRYFVSSSQTQFSYSSDSEIGGILVELKADLIDSGELEFDVYAGMTEQHFHDGNLLRILIYSLDGHRLPAGSENFLTVKNLAEFEISGLQMSSGEGQLMEVSYSAVAAVIPESYYLSANYPNPFNPETKISFHLPRTAWVELSVYNLLGQRVNTLVEGVLSPGEHIVSWDGRDYQGNNQSSGVYFYRIDSELGSLKRKMVLLK